MDSSLIVAKNGKMTITSLELVEQINLFREQEERRKTTHDSLLKIIRDEFSDEISLGELNESHYTNTRNQKQPMYYLTTLQAKQLLARESKYVRKALLIHIERLENFIREKASKEWEEARKLGKQIRLQETDAIKALIEYARVQGSQNADKLYMTYSKLVKQLVGHKSRDNATTEMLIEILMFERTLLGIITEEMLENTHYKEIYQRAKKQLMKLKQLWATPKLSIAS